MFRSSIVRPRDGAKQLNLLIPCDDTAMATFVIQALEVVTYTTVYGFSLDSNDDEAYRKEIHCCTYFPTCLTLVADYDLSFMCLTA